MPDNAFRGRLNRWGFIEAGLALIVVRGLAALPAVLGFLGALRAASVTGMAKEQIGALAGSYLSLASPTGILYEAVNVLVTVVVVGVFVRRLHDLGRDGRFAWVVPVDWLARIVGANLLPLLTPGTANFAAFTAALSVLEIPAGVVAIWLLLAKGSDQPNAYGPAPVAHPSLREAVLGARPANSA